MSDPAAAIADFVGYVQTHLSGDEKGEAADYIDLLWPTNPGLPGLR